VTQLKCEIENSRGVEEVEKVRNTWPANRDPVVLLSIYQKSYRLASYMLFEGYMLYLDMLYQGEPLVGFIVSEPGHLPELSNLETPCSMTNFVLPSGEPEWGLFSCM